MLTGPGEAQKWMQGAKWQNSEKDIQDSQSSTSQRTEKVHNIATELSQSISRALPACTGWSIFQTHTPPKR